MIERIYSILRAAQIDVRLATLHVGACDAPYCVLYEGQTEPGRSVAVRHALVDVLVPAARPEQLSQEIGRVQSAMMAAGYRRGMGNPALALDDYKAVSVTLDFSVLCAL